MIKILKKKFIFVIFILNCATSTQPVSENIFQETKPISLLNKKLNEFSSSVFIYSEILDSEINLYRSLVTSHCNIEGAKEVGEKEFPFYEKEIRINSEQNSFFCKWNFRKEVIEFSIQDKQSGQMQVDTFWYENRPSSIAVFNSEKNIYITRSWQWSVFRRVWDPTFVYLEFDLIKENRRVEYYFSRYTGSIVQKKEFKTLGKKSIPDGWFYNYDANIEEEHCHLFKNGTIISKDRNLCEFPLF